MADLDAQFKLAVNEYKSGRKDKARDLLMEIVDKDEQHEQAWLYLSALVGTLEEQQICLENVLAINPNNARAKKGLEKVSQQIAARDAANAPLPPIVPPAPPADHSSPTPFSSFDWDASAPQPSSDFGANAAPSAPIGAEFETASGDSLMSSAPQLDAFPSFDSFEMPDTSLSDDSMMAWMDTGVADPPAFDTPAPPAPGSSASSSSVDWDRSGGTAAHGSGKQVDLPSAQEYDSWVQNLNINNAEAANPPAFPGMTGDTSGASLFGDTDYMIDDSAAMPRAGGSFYADEDIPDDQDEWGSDSQSGFTGMEFGVAESPAAAKGGSDRFNQRDSRSSFGTESLFGDDDDEEFDGGSAFGSPSLYTDEDELDAEDSVDAEFDDLDFSFDDDDEVDLSEKAVQKPSKAKAKAKTKTAATDEYARYFAQIPADIETKGSRRGAMLLGVVILLGLNAASFAMLLL